MPKVVSITPKEKDEDTGCHAAQGTQVLLDDGSYLQGVTKVTLVAEVGELWKAVIEVHPLNQKQIDALLVGVNVDETTETAKQTTGDDTEGK